MAAVPARIPGKLSGKGGWKTGRFELAQERVLDDRERTQYEKYQEYCQRVCDFAGAKDYVWFIVTQRIPSV